MRSRVDKIARIVAVQRQLHRLEEWKLIQLEIREGELQGQRQVIIDSFNDEEPGRALLVQPMARRLASLGREAGVVGQARRVQSDTVLAESRKLKQVERMEKAANLSATREGEKRRLEQTIGEQTLRAVGRAAHGSYET